MATPPDDSALDGPLLRRLFADAGDLLHRHIDADDVGAAAAYLLSDAARNVTGTTLYVDSGYQAMGM